MSDEVDTRISPSLHPETVRAVEGYNEDTAPFVADVVSAFNDAYSTISKLHNATAAAKDNPAWTEENRILIVGKEAAKQQDRLLRKMDAAAANLGKAIAHVEGELARPLKERAGLGNLNQEVRGHAKALDRSARVKLLNEAFAGNDVDTLQAILGAQPFLSGLSAPEHAHYLHRFNSTQNPSLVSRLTVMRAAMEKLGRDGTKVMIEVQKAVGAPHNRVKSIDLANERALSALRIEPA